nr:T9SS type A sorting domain-containing protein [uncultured Carboxylicivirga sp.]
MRKYYLPLILCFFALNLSAQSGGSTCTDAISAFVGENTFSGTQQSEQWFTYTATQSSKVIISSCGAGVDTKVTIYGNNGTCGINFLLRENDDFCDKQSKLTFSGTAGTEYFIVWQNLSDSEPFTWTIEETDWEQGEDCNLATEAVVGSTNYCDHTSAADQWFYYTPQANGSISISSCGSTTENTSVRVYMDCGSQVTGGEGCGDVNLTNFAVVKDQLYSIKWQADNVSGTYNWELTFNETPTGIDDDILNNIDVKYMSDEIRVVLANSTSAEVSIYNMAGSLVKKVISQSSQININASSFQKGLYIVQIKSPSGIVTRKLLID